jgi:hypothetical protein
MKSRERDGRIALILQRPSHIRDSNARGTTYSKKANPIIGQPHDLSSQNGKKKSWKKKRRNVVPSLGLNN